MESNQISLIDLRVYQIYWDSCGVLRVMVKPNVKFNTEDAEDYIKTSRALKAHFGMKVPVVMTVKGFASMSSGAKAAFRAVDFSEIFTAKAICTSDAYHRAILSFMIRLVGGQNYPIKVFGDESKGLEWVLSKSEESRQRIKENDLKVEVLHESLQDLSLHHMKA